MMKNITNIIGTAEKLLTYLGICICISVFFLAAVAHFTTLIDNDLWVRKVGFVGLSCYVLGVVMNAVHAFLTRGR